MLNALEHIINDPVRLEQYKQDPLRYASLMAYYNYLKAGNNLLDLPWFSLCKKGEQAKQEIIKKAA